jgi:NADPH-dependent curcumin reductase CurA
MSQRNRFWRLQSRPQGDAFEDALVLAEAPLDVPAEGQVVVRNELLSMDAGTRMWMSDRTDGYQPPLPLGSPMVGLVVGRVVASRQRDFPEGTLVRAFGQWSDHSIIDPVAAGAVALDESVADKRAWLGELGMNGWTALWGVERTGAAKAGETVLVSAAAGATGLLACQVAAALGCTVWGMAGGETKCRALVEDFGVAGAIDYKSGDAAARLAQIGGIDVYFDNVGGPLLDVVLPRMNHYGRIAVCGLVSDYTTGRRTAPSEYDQVLMRRLRIEGFFSPDFMQHGAELTARLRGWYEDGRLRLPFDTASGLENTLVAYRRMLTGASTGKAIVELET